MQFRIFIFSIVPDCQLSSPLRVWEANEICILIKLALIFCLPLPEKQFVSRCSSLEGYNIHLISCWNFLIELEKCGNCDEVS